MTEKTGVTRTFVPKAPHRDSLANHRLSITDEGGTILVHFCPINACGAVWYPNLGKWVIYTPVSAAEFAAALPKLGVRLADAAALQAWLDEIMVAAPPSVLN
ncbi:MAG TPA: hypothetical protein VGM97_11365 [Steroidobacteraceae bacterium]|jgi:hypothetical protein